MTNYNSAIPYIANVYGEEEQLTQLAEESAELAQAALKRRKAQIGQTKYGNTRDALAEEIADTLIMIEQIVYLEGFEDGISLSISIREPKLIATYANNYLGISLSISIREPKRRLL